MAIQWGAWEPGSLPQLRVGVEVLWSSVTNSSSSVTATVKYYTEANGDWWDDQTMTLSGKITGSFTFTNHQTDGSVVQRAIREWTYNYPSDSYGTSPGTATFGAAVSGCFNGATPSKSVTVNIPARPIGVPAAPTNVTSTYISDTSIKTSWTNNSTAAKPWSAVRVQIDGPPPNDIWNGDVGVASGTATSLTDSTNPEPNASYRYRVRSENSVGESAWVEGPIVRTSPATPTGVSVTLSGTSFVVSWTNNVSYDNYQTEVWHYANGVKDSSPLATVSAGVTSWTHTSPASGVTHSYQLRAKTSVLPILYSGWSTVVSAGQPASTPPNPPTNLSPNGQQINPTYSTILSWQHNPTDGSSQSSYEVQWSVNGGSYVSTGRIYSSNQYRTVAANTFPGGASVSWMVRTWGTSATASNWSSTATFTTIATGGTVGSGVNPPSNIRPLALDTTTGEVQAMPAGMLVPTGTVLPFAGGTAPPGWLLCNGQEVSQTTYAALYSVIGTTYGAATSGYFKLPDLRNRSPVGAGSSYSVGTTGGSTSIYLSTSQMPSHTHSVSVSISSAGDHTHSVSGSTNTAGAHTHNVDQSNAAGSYGGRFARGTTTLYASGPNGMSEAGSHSHTVSGTAASAGSHTHTATASVESAGGSSSVDIRDPFIALNFIIKT